MNHKVTIEPNTEPVTLEEAKTHLRVTSTAEDSYISSLITIARQWCEGYENTKYITQTVTVKYNAMRSVIELPVGPAQSVTSFKYIDDDQIEQTIDTADYVLDTYSMPPLVYEAYDVEFPTPLDIRNAVEIVYVAGFGDADAVPERIKQAIKLILTHLYEHREQNSELKLEEMPMNAKDLLFERVF